MEKLETGLSGCKLELIDSNILRKHSSSEPYNKRLDLQIRKQQLFSNRVCRNIETPKILVFVTVNIYKTHSFDNKFLNSLNFTC